MSGIRFYCALLTPDVSRLFGLPEKPYVIANTHRHSAVQNAHDAMKAVLHYHGRLVSVPVVERDADDVSLAQPAPSKLTLQCHLIDRLSPHNTHADGECYSCFLREDPRVSVTFPEMQFSLAPSTVNAKQLFLNQCGEVVLETGIRLEFN